MFGMSAKDRASMFGGAKTKPGDAKKPPPKKTIGKAEDKKAEDNKAKPAAGKENKPEPAANKKVEEKPKDAKPAEAKKIVPAKKGEVSIDSEVEANEKAAAELDTSMKGKAQTPPKAGDKKAQTPPKLDAKKPEEKKAQTPPKAGVGVKKAQTPPKADEKKAQTPPKPEEKKAQTPPKAGDKKAQTPPKLDAKKPEEKKAQTPPKAGVQKAQTPPKADEKKAQTPPKPEQKKAQTPPKPDDKKAQPPPKQEQKKAQTPPKQEPKKAQTPPKQEPKKAQTPPKPDEKKTQPPAKPEEKKAQTAPKPEPKVEAKQAVTAQAAPPGKAQTPPKAPEVKKEEPKKTETSKRPAPKFQPPTEDLYNALFYFSGMGGVIGSAMVEGIYVPDYAARRAPDADVIEEASDRSVKSKFRGYTIVQTCRTQAGDLTDELKRLREALAALPTFGDSTVEGYEKEMKVEKPILAHTQYGHDGTDGPDGINLIAQKAAQQAAALASAVQNQAQFQPPGLPGASVQGQGAPGYGQAGGPGAYGAGGAPGSSADAQARERERVEQARRDAEEGRRRMEDARRAEDARRKAEQDAREKNWEAARDAEMAEQARRKAQQDEARRQAQAGEEARRKAAMNQPRRAGSVPSISGRPYGVHTGQANVDGLPSWQNRYGSSGVTNMQAPQPFGKERAPVEVSGSGIKPWQMSRLRGGEAKGIFVQDDIGKIHSQPKQVEQQHYTDEDVPSLAPFLTSDRSKRRDLKKAYTDHGLPFEINQPTGTTPISLLANVDSGGEIPYCDL